MSSDIKLYKEKEKIKIQREKIKNAKMIGEVIKVYLDNFKYLITIIVTVFVTLANLGWITYGTMHKPKLAILESSSDVANNELGETVVGVMASTQDVGMTMQDFLINSWKIGAILFNIGLIVLALYFRKKDKEKKAKKEADAKNPNSKIIA